MEPKGSTPKRVNALMYANGTRFEAKCGKGPLHLRAHGTPAWLAGAVAVLLLIGAGAAYRGMASRLRTILNTPIELPVSLDAVPMDINGWTGQELATPAVTQDYMETNFADDFISRRYTNLAKGLWADVYVVYCSSQPAGILGHQPRVCFPAHGWIHDQTVASQIISAGQHPIRCLIHQFHNASTYQQVVVLSFYVLNGQITLTERDFAGFFGRRPNLSGDPARYVAQVQVSSVLENCVRLAASDLADTLLAFLPDQDGRVRAVDMVEGLAGEKRTVQDAR